MLLSSRLKHETARYHLKAERHQWVKQLFFQKLPVITYYHYLSLLLPVYQCLELQWEVPILNQLKFYGLNRAEKIVKDIQALESIGDARPIKNQSQYSEHLVRISSRDAHRFIAHYYVRYFGDLMGGQRIKTCLLKHYAFSEQALNFYDFQEFKKEHPESILLLRNAINELDLSMQQKKEIIDEAKKAFILTYQLMSQSQQKLY